MSQTENEIWHISEVFRPFFKSFTRLSANQFRMTLVGDDEKEMEVEVCLTNAGFHARQCGMQRETEMETFESFEAILVHFAPRKFGVNMSRCLQVKSQSKRTVM
eukprot:GHVO01048173.1.p2 GENE.GHVO01048173.1~~GHVO01048173.1.p2  ORF type:complete len:104 (+),score=13.20 GHVO01048173.1:63-374(+)